MTETVATAPCHQCQGGRKSLRSATFMTWLGNDLITVPDFPAWICDICGHRSYDRHALVQLSLLLNSESGISVQNRIQFTENPPPVTSQPHHPPKL